MARPSTFGPSTSPARRSTTSKSSTRRRLKSLLTSSEEKANIFNGGQHEDQRGFTTPVWPGNGQSPENPGTRAGRQVRLAPASQIVHHDCAGDSHRQHGGLYGGYQDRKSVV